MTHFTMTRGHRADLAATGATEVFVERPNGPRLCVLDYRGAGKPVLMLPGITTPAICFDFVARAFAGDYRVLSLDIRGRGQSDNGQGWSLDDYVDDVEAVVDGLALQHPILVGHSMGARIAAQAAARTPGAYCGAVIIDPPLTGPGRPPYPMALVAFESQLEEAYAGTTADEVARWWPRWPRQELELRSRWLASCDLEAVRGSYRSFEEEDFLTTWRRTTVPAWFISGAESLVVTESGLADCKSAKPDAEYSIVPTAGHMVFWDNYSDAVRLLREALGSLSGPSNA